MQSQRAANLLVITAISGFLSVAIGAFAAHGLKNHLTDYGLEIFKTAHLYQSIHTLALFGIVVLFLTAGQNRWLSIAATCFVLGIVIFSGSLYTLALTQINWLGAITPIGGLFFLAGWSCLGISASKMKKILDDS